MRIPSFTFWIPLLMLCAALARAAEGEALGAGMENPGYEAPPEWFKVSFLDLREDVAEASAAGKGLMLYFFQDGCPYCKKLLQDNFGNREIADTTQKHFDVVALNMWGDREVTDLNGAIRTEKAFAAAAKVMFTPTLILFDTEGRVALRLNGYYPPHQFLAALRYVAGGHHRNEKFRAWSARHAPPPAAGELHREEGFLMPPVDLSRREGTRPLAVLFEQKQCAPCDELHRDALPRPEVRAALGRLDVAQLDLWGDEAVVTPKGERTTAAAWARELEVHYAPSLIFFDEAGEEVFRAEAYLRPFHLRNVLDYVATGAYREQPSFQRYIEAVADEMRERGEAVDLMR